jgi:hypothetical protein
MKDSMVLETGKIKAEMDPKTLKITVFDKKAGFKWETAADDPHDLGYRIGDVSHEVSFASKQERRVLRTGRNAFRVLFPQLSCYVGFALSAERDDQIEVNENVKGEQHG